MANTVIQLKFSTITSAPTTLNVGEPAYSYTSNTFFIGSPAGTGAIAIGGRFYLDQQQQIFDSVNASFTQANTNLNSVTAAFNHGNSAFGAANTAQATGTAAFIQANTNLNSVTAAFIHANSAFDAANSAVSSSGGVITGSLSVTQNVTVQGNLTVLGTQTIVDSTIVKIADNIITLNAAVDQASAPILDSGLEIDRGSSANVYVLWNETIDKWTFTNNGTDYMNIGAESGEVYANGAFLAANSAQVHANYGFNHANAAFDVANTNTNSVTAAFNHANAAFGVANTDVTNIAISGGHFGSASQVSAFEVAANGRIISANATSIAISADAITSGTLPVERGGTGAVTFTTNGILLGQGTSAISTVSSSTEGHVLTINDSGVPTFTMLSGGTF